MHLKIHNTRPGSEFNLNNSLNLFPFPAILNKLFRRVINPRIETSTAMNLNQAHELQLFEHGWLPNILPPSTHRLQLVKSPEIYFAQGEYFFAPFDWQDFSAKLEPEQVLEQILEAPFVNWATSLRRMQRAGHSLWHYCEQNRHWMFFCKADEGYCEFVMWMLGSSEYPQSAKQ